MADRRHMNRRILVIDDTQSIHDDFRAILASDNQALTDIHEEEAAIFGDTSVSQAKETFEVDGAFQGEEAVAMAHTALDEGRPYALAFVDMRMPPGWDGLKTIEKLWEVCPDLETVICSAYSDHDWHSITERLGTASNLLVLKKPYDNIEILQMAMALTEKWNLKQEAETKYRTIFENSAVSIMLLDEKERLLSWNQFTEKMLEMSHDDLHLREAKTLHPEKDWDAIGSLHVERQNHGLHLETSMTKKSGDIIDVDMSVSVLRDTDNCITGFVRVARDITERRHARQILEREKKNLESIFEAAPFGLLLVDEHMQIQRANDAIRSLSEKDHADIINQSPGIALGCIQVAETPEPGNLQCGGRQACEECVLFNTIKESINSNRSVHKSQVHMTLVRHGKHVQPVLSLSAEPVIIDGSRHIVVAIEDVTARVKADEEFHSAMELKSQFISMVSHELRTPLAAMKEAITIVHDDIAGPTNKDQNHFLSLAAQNINRLCRLVDDVLDFQKLDVNEMSFIMKEEDLGGIVKEAYDTMVHFANKRKIGLSLDIDPKIPTCHVDSDRMTQVLTNIMSNAIKYTPAGGQVTVRLRHADGELVLSIIDTGMGIPQEDIEQIFTRFYRAKLATNTIKGTGLGLPIAKHIVEKHGGRIEIKSELDKGTTFAVYLPLNQTARGGNPSVQTDRIVENATSAG